MKIVILDGYTVNPGDLTWKALEDIADIEIYDRTQEDDVVDRCKGAEIVLTNKVILDASILNMLPRLQYIGVLATGYNVVDIESASKQNVIVTNIPAYSTESVAQMVFAHLLNISNRADYYARQNREGKWASSEDFCYLDHPYFELKGKRMGIVGFGNTGQATARIALALGINVHVLTSKSQEDLPNGITKDTLDEILAESDIISLHCPLTPETRHMINSETLAKMKPTAILINTGRGPLVNEQDVAEALSQKTIAAYCADVLEQEPPLADNPLFAVKNAFITPHIAWATKEARQRLIDICVQNVKAFVDGKAINVINPTE